VPLIHLHLPARGLICMQMRAFTSLERNFKFLGKKKEKKNVLKI